MALTATATQGFEYVREVGHEEVLYMPGDPGDSIVRGDLLTATVGEGVLDAAAADEVHYCKAESTVTVAAASTAFPVPKEFDPANSNSTLVPTRHKVPAGTPVQKCTFSGHWDDTVISYTASTRALALTTGMTADDYPNGGLLYVYEGTGAGQVNVVEDYDHADGAAALLLICHRAFETALDSTSKIIVVGGEAATSRGIGFYNRIALADANTLDATDGANDGEFVVYMDWREAAEYLKNLTLPVVPAASLLMV